MSARRPTWKRCAAGIAVTASVAVTHAALAGDTWHAAGASDHVDVKTDAGAIAVKADEPVTAGALSAEKPVRSRADVVLVQATVSGAAERGVTFSVQDSKSGESVGYWQNRVPAEAETLVAAALPLARVPAKARLFAGTHNQPSHATIRDVTWTPAKRGAAYHGSIWGVYVDGARDASQTFVASPGKLAAVTVRMRHFTPGQTSPGLRVRVHEFANGDIAAARRSKPIGETHLTPAQIPHGEEGNEKDITIPLSAPTQAGKTYVLTFALTDKAPQEQGLLLWAGPGIYPDGHRYENDQPHETWDLYFETFYAE